jgi:3,8-divinyl chlorophyllide a/chlorophyllide a reductase subunit Y
VTDLTALPAEDRARDRIDLGGVSEGGCASKDTMRDAAKKAGKTEILDQYAADYPVGPHDQPQSMCPAFGSLRVGLRMRRTATILSGSACCVYGLTFTSHFYGARRSVGYVPFSSETLVTGKLFEDIKEAVELMADPEKYDTIVVTNLCVPTMRTPLIESGSSLSGTPLAVGTHRLVTTIVSYFSGSAINSTASLMSSNSLPVTSVSELNGT